LVREAIEELEINFIVSEIIDDVEIISIL